MTSGGSYLLHARARGAMAALACLVQSHFGAQPALSRET